MLVENANMRTREHGGWCKISAFIHLQHRQRCGMGLSKKHFGLTRIMLTNSYLVRVIIN
jgi:hypothetical protein